MENYYHSLSASQPENINQFTIQRIGDNYRVFLTCPNIGGTLPYVEYNRDGYTTDVGTTSFDANSRVYLGIGCSSTAGTISTVSLSNSLFDVPTFAPFAPLYFLLIFVFCIALVKFAYRFIYGYVFG